ncbi:MAG: DNA-processing protein DprA, partial [Christensenellales bacterium]
PPTIYAIGEANLNRERMFAIVGSRRCTRDGARAAREFAEKLARESVTVVSGLAFGIDGAAHEGAVQAGEPTIAVLGCGADVVYPAEHARLYADILEGGGAILSEYPPGMPPLAAHFPARNRIISGMSAGVLLVEGARRSGAMITVQFALEQGRDVFAVPGSIYSPLSATPNQLIVEGAIPAISPWDILEYRKWGQRPRVDAPSKAEIELSEEESAVLHPLARESMTPTQLCEITGFHAKKIFSILTTLELRGIINRQPGGAYRAGG